MKKLRELTGLSLWGIVSLGLCILSLTACGPAVKAPEKITVIMPRHEMDLKGVWERQTRDFEKATGITVEFIQMSWDEVATKVMTDLASGSASTYDVIEFDNGWVAKFAAADWVEPLDQYGDKAYFDSLVPGLRNTFTSNGKTLGVVWNNDTRFFFYNKAMLAKAGIANPPQNWKEFVDQAKKLQKAGVSAFPVAESWTQEWALASSLAYYLYNSGEGYFDAEGKITINRPEAVSVFQQMVDLLKKDKVMNPSSVTLTQEGVADLFYRGSTAFFLQGPPSTYSYANDPKKSSVVGQIEVASTLPAKSPEFQATLTLPEAFAIPKTSKNKEAAWKYIQYMISVEKDKERAQEIGSLPLFQSLYNDPQLLQSYPYWTQFGKQAALSRPLPQVEWYDELVQKTIVDLQEMLLAKKTAQAAADDIATFLEGKVVNGKPLHK